MRELGEQANIHCWETKELVDRKWHQGSKDGELSHSIKLSAKNFLCHVMLWMSSFWWKIECGCACLSVHLWVCMRESREPEMEWKESLAAVCALMLPSSVWWITPPCQPPSVPMVSSRHPRRAWLDYNKMFKSVSGECLNTVCKQNQQFAAKWPQTHYLLFVSNSKFSTARQTLSVGFFRQPEYRLGSTDPNSEMWHRSKKMCTIWSDMYTSWMPNHPCWIMMWG